MNWNLKDLRKNIENCYGKAQREILSPYLDSIFERRIYAQFHFQEFERLLSEFLTDKEDKTSLTTLILGIDKEESSNFHICKIQVRAHVIACLQSMHAISDTLSHVIYYSLNMNNNKELKIKPHRVDIDNVLEKLKISPEYKKICKLINELIKNPEYKYLKDIVNRSKHRSIIDTPFIVHLLDDDERPHGLEFCAFKHDGKSYPKRWVDDYLKSEYYRQGQLIVNIGKEINQTVRSKALIG